MSQGTITSLDAGQGIGLIKIGQQEVMFRRSDVQDVIFEELQLGQTVEFKIEEGAQGARATSVRPVAQPVA